MSLTNNIDSVISIVRGLINDKERTDGRDAFVYKTDSTFTLSEDFINSSTITVFQNGTELDSTDWDYNSDNNQVTIEPVTSGVSLETDDIILIKYSYYKKYSDTELQGFIQSSLSYFVEYKYKKTFEVIDDTVITLNGVNPTKEELYIISMVASILIDPQNVEINIPDLRLSAKRDKSDQEQIKEVFINFKKFLGTIDFRFIENLE